MSELKNKLKQFRFMNGELTQQELAEKVSVSRQTIIAIETVDMCVERLAKAIKKAGGIILLYHQGFRLLRPGETAR